jgi:hypothetical protein
MMDLTEAGRDLRDATPDRPPTLEVLAERGRRQRRRSHRAALLSTAIVVGVIGVVGLAVTVLPRHEARVITRPQSTGPLTVAPPGARFVDYGNLRIAIPTSWWIVGDGSSIQLASIQPDCGQSIPGVVTLGTGRALSDVCGPSDIPVVAVKIHSDAPPTDAATTVINGLTVYRSKSSGSTTYDIPQLGASITFVDAPPLDSILATLSPSSLHEALATTPDAIPADWQNVHYRDVDLRVPAAWPVNNLDGTQRIPIFLCGSPATPQVDLGNALATPSCPASNQPPPPLDRVWIYRDPEPRDTTALTARTINGISLYIDDHSTAPAALEVLIPSGSDSGYVVILIGLGPNGRVAGAILQSIQQSETPTTSN